VVSKNDRGELRLVRWGHQLSDRFPKSARNLEYAEEAIENIRDAIAEYLMSISDPYTDAEVREIEVAI
jgi:hypothetical protein